MRLGPRSAIERSGIWRLEDFKYMLIASFGFDENGADGRKNLIAPPQNISLCQDSGGENNDVQRCHKEFEFVLQQFLSKQDTCEGDSGAPVHLWTENDNLAIVGLVSRSIKLSGNNPPSPSKHCDGLGGIYVNLTHPDITAWLFDLDPSIEFVDGNNVVLPPIVLAGN